MLRGFNFSLSYSICSNSLQDLQSFSGHLHVTDMSGSEKINHGAAVYFLYGIHS